MTQEAGIIRTANGLQEGLENLLHLEQTEIFEENEYYSLVAKNLLTVAELIIRSALFRKERAVAVISVPTTPPRMTNTCVTSFKQKGKEIKTTPVISKPKDKS